MIQKYLLENGWKRIITACRCGWPKYHHEAYPGYKIEVYPSRNKCAIMKNNFRCVPHNVSGDDIEITLKNIFEK